MSDVQPFVFDSDRFLPANHWTVIAETVSEDGSVTCELAWIELGPDAAVEPLVTVSFR